MFYDGHAKDQVNFALYVAQQHDDEEMFINPVHLDVTFFVPIPKDCPKKLPSKYSVKNPTIDSLYKYFIDAIRDIIVPNNTVICALSIKKMYDKDPRTEFTITEV
jgi:Holliday junction resolvase RusA-like endonuclease